jgi:formylglycine-generating enzyme required for sulfatase activity
MIQFQKFLEEGDYFSEKWWKYLKKPDSPPLQKFKVSNYPCDSISWGDAIAFCRWLTESLSSDTFQDSISNNKEKTTWFVRLPTEWEWEYAATGGQSSFQYPWGKNWDSNLANTAESGLSRTTAVGMYPLAKSPTGALDMSGNVREWCVNEYDSMKTSIDDQIAVRALRGGSWANSKKDAMTTTRLFDNPEFRASNVGFRVALINTQTRRETDEIW